MSSINYAAKIKQDILSTGVDLMKGTWKSFLVFQILATIVSLVVVFLLLFPLLGISFDDLGEIMQAQSNPMLLAEIMQDKMAGIMAGFSLKTVLMGFLSFGVLMLLTFWMQIAQYKISENHLKGTDQDLFTIAKEAFNGKIGKMFGVFFVMVLLYIALAIAMSIVFGLLGAALGGILGGLLIFLAFIGLGIFLIRFVLVIPAIIIGDMNVFQSFSYSSDKISFGKAAKYFGIGIVFMIIYGIIMVIVQSAVGLILSGSLVGGVILNQIISLIVGSIIGALFTGLMVALYYRESGLVDSLDGENSIDTFEHLVD